MLHHNYELDFFVDGKNRLARLKLQLVLGPSLNKLLPDPENHSFTTKYFKWSGFWMERIP